mgnify:CR=1 FL=1
MDFSKRTVQCLLLEVTLTDTVPDGVLGSTLNMIRSIHIIYKQKNEKIEYKKKRKKEKKNTREKKKKSLQIFLYTS